MNLKPFPQSVSYFVGCFSLLFLLLSFLFSLFILYWHIRMNYATTNNPLCFLSTNHLSLSNNACVCLCAFSTVTSQRMMAQKGKSYKHAQTHWNCYWSSVLSVYWISIYFVYVSAYELVIKTIINIMLFSNNKQLKIIFFF